MNTCHNDGCMNMEDLHIHHIDYDKNNNNNENLITLCISCHMKTANIKNKEYCIKYYFEIANLYL